MIPGIVAGIAVTPTPPPTDPYYANVVSLLNFPGADGSTTFTDAKGKVWTPQGSAQIDTSLGYNAGQFPGSPSRLDSPTDADWAMGTGDFTVEAWIRPSNLSTDRNIFGVNVSGGLGFGTTSSALFCGPTAVSYGVIGSTGLPLNTLVHVAACKASGTMRVFVNGVVDGSGADSYNYAQAEVMLASNRVPPSAATGYLEGWIRAFRLTKGVARYTANFTPPTAPFPTS